MPFWKIRANLECTLIMHGNKRYIWSTVENYHVRAVKTCHRKYSNREKIYQTQFAFLVLSCPTQYAFILALFTHCNIASDLKKKINGNIPQIKETMKNNDLPLKTNFFYLSQTSPDIIEPKITIMIDNESLSPWI